ncbi:MAG: hypothetical protein HZB39_00720 [Planctomycetes bacterium]|nr:hypothetical protein [Planctomycetota bacterium]
MRTATALALFTGVLVLGATAAQPRTQTQVPVRHGVVAQDRVVPPGPNAPQPPRIMQESPHKHGMPVVPIGYGGNPQPQNAPVLIADPLAEAGGTYVHFRNDLVKPAGASSSRIAEPACVFADQNNGFFTANWYAARTQDGGANWAYVNPYTAFAAAFGGFCCDQRLVTTGGTTVWMLQYVADGSGNGGTRLAVATNSANLGAGAFSHSWMFTPQLMGFAAGTWFDFPDCASSGSNFYFASNVFNASSQFVGAVVWRADIAAMAAGGSLGFQYVTSPQIGGASYRLTQNAGARIFWAYHESTTSMRTLWWDDGVNSVFWESKPMAAWSFNYSADPGPDGRDWTARADSRILGAYQSLTEFGFLWHSGPIGVQTRNFVRLARFALADRALLEERSIYNNGLSFMYPAAATNAAGHIGIACAIGGGAYFPSSVSVLKDDLENLSSARFLAGGNAGPTSNVWGDYFTVQRPPFWPWEQNFVATGMALNGGGANANQEPRAIQFGREAFQPGFTGLMVLSSPFNGVPITLVPADRFGEAGANTPFYRSFTQSFANITATAPSTMVSGGATWFFERWAAKAVPGTTSFGLGPVGQLSYTIGSIGVQADTLEARYLRARTLTVQSTNPAAGTAIAVSPVDFDGNANGSTSFTRRYRDGQPVTLTAPSAVGFNPFKQWRVDGVGQTPGQLAVVVTMDADHTAVADYFVNVAGTITDIGPGCRGSSGVVPSHTITWPGGQQGPQQGTPTTYSLSQARPISPCALSLGFSDRIWGAFRLPLDLGIIGVTNCFQRHDIISTESATTGIAGNASKTFVWPVNASAIGLPLFTSWFIVDPGTGRPTTLTLSNAMRSAAGGNL